MKLETKNSQLICGLDECGRGSLAGPLVAAGVIIKFDPQELVANSPVPIRDSKKLSSSQRVRLINYLENVSISVKICYITVEQINTHGISWANKQVFINIINSLAADKYIVDGNLRLRIKNYESRITKNDNSKTNHNSPFLIHNSTPKVVSQPKADEQVLEVMLASVIAKVFRDNLMKDLHEFHPQYNWRQNKGYGTRQHIEALINHGVCEFHRQQFANTAIRNWIGKREQKKLLA